VAALGAIAWVTLAQAATKGVLALPRRRQEADRSVGKTAGARVTPQ
jgi:hypothetical protein